MKYKALFGEYIETYNRLYKSLKRIPVPEEIAVEMGVVPKTISYIEDEIRMFIKNGKLLKTYGVLRRRGIK